MLTALVPLAAENWPGWRGTNGDGIATGAAAPLRWSKTENVKWRTALPEAGNSTPVIWGDSIFVTQAKKASGERLLLCFDRTTGKQKWQAVVPYTADEPTHPTNPYASASPATDGERVIAWFGSAGLHAFHAKTGAALWNRDLGMQKHTWGYASSPVIYRDWVFLNFGPGERSFLIALEKKTGKTVWQVNVPPGSGVKHYQWSADDKYGSWSTPVIANVAGRDPLIVTHPRKLAAYEPANGKAIWSSDGLTDLVYPSPVVAVTDSGDQVVLAASGFGGSAMAVKTGGSGDVTATHRSWHWEKTKGFIGTAVVHRGHLYWIDMQGVVQCVRLSSGQVAWTARLPVTGEDAGVWSSPVLVGANIYVMNKSGNTLIFQADPGAFELIGTNSLDEQSNASVVVVQDEIFLRTFNALWCISARHHR
jgi:outer membrane protein assembly factor BamB